MKNLMVAAALSLACMLPAQAQLTSREALGGAALGGVLGGVIGHNNGRKTAEGAAIGAGAGLLLGAVTHNARREYYSTYPPASAPPPPYTSPSYHAPTRPHHAVSGAVLGGIAGGVIGHNNGRKTAEGIAIGAGTGLLLGTLAEQNARRRQQPPPPPPVVQYVVPPPQLPAIDNTSPSPAPAAHDVPALPPQYLRHQPNHTMSSANSLFGR